MPALKKIGAAALAAFGWTSGGAASVTASYLQVAGGGGGGGGAGQSNGAGGGGAGGYLTGTTSLNPTLSYTVVVGAGGAGGSTSVYNSTGTSGSNSSITGLTASVGGGGAGGTNGTGGVGNGQSGGSGGGGNSAGTGGTATSGQGNNGGGSVTTGPNYGGGGGGGASAVGATGTTTAGGNGGNGSASSISGSSVTYAGGGGAGTYNGGTVGTGGTGGGGNAGANSGANGSNGTANLGGGGGGASFNLSPSAPFSGGQGGSGIVIISYAGAQQFGGGVVTSVGGNTIHTFLTSGTLSPLSSLSASYLIVAGGGGGHGNYSGGGGGGGFLAASGVTIDTSSTYVVTVGAGGSAGSNGGNSTFSIVATAAVGGGGGGYTTASGAAGGSGGGAGNGVGQTGGAGTSGQGNAGGASGGATTTGGGGGAGAVGTAGNGALQSGAGGNGLTSSISGTSTYYAGGGGGGGNGSTGVSGGAGGLGGGGAGATTNATAGTNGTANTGGGSGGSSGGAYTPTAFGGSGIVIISYAGSTQQMAGGSVTITGGNVIHTFTSSGYLTPLTYYSNSLRFRSSVSAYLSRTPTSTGNLQKFTFSIWVKRGALGAFTNIFDSFPSGSVEFFVGFDGSDRLVLADYQSGDTLNLTSTAVYRDPAAWYHIVVAVDTTQATSTERAKLYVNGVQLTAFATAIYPTQNLNTAIWNTSFVSAIGARGRTFATPANMYLSNFNFIDGQQLTPNSFGTFNSYGVWQPINYGGSYGTNGFYLPFNAITTSSYAAEYSGSNYIISPSGVNYNVSGDYTFETWVYFAGNPNNNVSKFIFDHRSSTGAGGITLVQESSDNTWTAWNASNVFVGNTIVAGRWYHMAISRQSGTQRVFLNGILTNTTADASTYNTDQVSLGTRYSGTNSLPSGAYLSNLRFVVGTALYTTNFTPSTTPLTAVTNTKLLTFQNSTIIDNSGLSNTLTNTGSLATTVQYPFSINVFNDQSPQGNNWTPNAFSLLNGSNYDSMTDVPTLTSATASNFAVMNPVYLTASNTTNNGNLGFTALPAANSNVLSTMAISSGSWYMELTMTATTGNGGAGFGPTTTNYYSTRILTGGSGYGCYFTGQVVAAGVLGATYTAFTTAGDIMMLAFDATNGKLFVGRNGTWFNSGNPAAGTGAVLTGIPANTYYFGIEGGGVANITGNMNFGQRPFRYTPPSGFVALNTFNL
jgi:hypothetical protein